MIVNLRAKVLIFTIAIIVILLVTSHIVTNTVVARNLESQLEKRAEAALDSFNEWLVSQKEQTFSTAQILASGDWLKGVIVYDDPLNLGRVLELRRGEPEFLMVESIKYAETENEWTYQIVDQPLRYGLKVPRRGQELKNDGRWMGGFSEIVADSDRLLLTVGEPVWSEGRIKGMLTLGSIIDTNDVDTLRYMCGCDQLTLIIDEGRSLMTTFEEARREKLVASLAPRRAKDASFNVEIDGERFLTKIQPLKSATGETVADAYMQFTFREVEQVLGEISNALNLAALGAFAVFSLVSIVFSGRLTGQLNRLVAGVTALGEGRYEEPVTVTSRDEVGVLSRAFDELRLSLRQRTQQLVDANVDLDRRVREIASLNNVMVAIASNRPMEEVFAVISREAGKHLRVDYAYLVLLREERSGVRLLAWHAEPGAPQSEPELAPGASLAEKAAVGGEIVEISGLSSEGAYSDAAWMAGHGLRSACMLPLRSEVAGIGAICFAGLGEQALDDHLRSMLERLATEITIALQRMRLNEELQLIESRLSRLFDSVRDGVFQTDHVGNIVLLNAAAQAMFGSPDLEGGGWNIEKMLVLPEERDELLRRLNADGYVTIFPATLARADGTTFDAELTVNFTDEEPGKRGIEGIVRNVTQRKQLEQQLLRSERLASMGQIAASVAHEINNPLSIILGFTQDLLSSTSENDPERQDLIVIEHETERCARIVKDLLNLAHAGETEHQPLKLDEILNKTLTLYRLHLREGGIELDTDFRAVPSVSGDARQLQQVFMNVIINAIQAMQGGGSLRVELRPTRAGEVQVKIRDTGGGIDQMDLEHIFDPFFTTKRGSGAGLGLFIVHRLVEAHSGRVEISSRRGKGTTCTITLPAAEGIN